MSPDRRWNQTVDWLNCTNFLKLPHQLAEASNRTDQNVLRSIDWSPDLWKRRWWPGDCKSNLYVCAQQVCARGTWARSVKRRNQKTIYFFKFTSSIKFAGQRRSSDINRHLISSTFVRSPCAVRRVAALFWLDRVGSCCWFFDHSDLNTDASVELPVWLLARTAFRSERSFGAANSLLKRSHLHSVLQLRPKRNWKFQSECFESKHFWRTYDFI